MAFTQTYEKALEKRQNKPPKPRKPIARGTKGLNSRHLSVKALAAGENGNPTNGLKRRGIARGRATGAAGTRFRAKPNKELAVWGREVKRRDGNVCQWVDCEFCRNSFGALLDPHHKALRSARADLRLVLDNGVTVCRRRHDWIHSPEGHDEAVRMGFLNERTRELAAKERTLGIR